MGPDVGSLYLLKVSPPPSDSLILYAFSHRDPVHLYMNMSMFWTLAPEVSRMYGCRGFLGLYVGGALVSSIGGMGMFVRYTMFIKG